MIDDNEEIYVAFSYYAKLNSVTRVALILIQEMTDVLVFMWVLLICFLP